MNRIIFVFLLLIVLGGFVWYALRDRGNAPAPSIELSMLRYENAEYGYAVAYPPGLTYREYALGNTVFGTEEGEAMQGAVEVRLLEISGEPGQSLEDAVAAETRNLCAADGPTSTFSCTQVEQLQPFTTRTGGSGFVFYLRGELTDFPSGETTVIGKGPFFAIPMRSSATASRVLLVLPPLNQTADEAEADLVRMVAESAEVAS